MKSETVIGMGSAIVLAIMAGLIIGQTRVEAAAGMRYKDIKALKEICELDIPRTDTCTVRVVISPPVKYTNTNSSDSDSVSAVGEMYGERGGSSCARSDGKPCEVE